jgi:hypothetical protein
VALKTQCKPTSKKMKRLAIIALFAILSSILPFQSLTAQINTREYFETHKRKQNGKSKTVSKKELTKMSTKHSMASKIQSTGKKKLKSQNKVQKK